jgi:Phage integrase, N-terminal SAM-like domain
MSSSVGQVLFAFFEDYLKVQRGLRPGSIRSYRDTLKLFLTHIATACRRPITRLNLSDLSSDRVLEFLRTIETTRNSKASTRNQRLAALRTFYRCLAAHHPDMLGEAERVEAIPTKRTSPPETIWSVMRSRRCSKAYPSRAAWRSGIERFLCFYTTREPERRRSRTCGSEMLIWSRHFGLGSTVRETSGESARSGRKLPNS